MDITPDLLKKYDKAGPRYTSYPTAPEWHDDFGSGDYRSALERAGGGPREALALYVHVPFCEKRCHFCGCNVVISKKPEIVERFLDLIGMELSLVADALGERRRLVQLHWGGGTPTYMSVPQIERLFAEILGHFRLDEEAEIALEVDPRVTTQEQIQTLRKLGFNRISMGVQDLDPVVQRAIGRNQTEEQTRQIFSWCREVGYLSINVDLIYGLPAQNMEGWERTIHSIIDMGPDRLAVYSYAHLPSKLKHQARINPETLPATEEKYALFALARRSLVNSGYRPIGMDHFAHPDDELSKALDEGCLYRNFMGYTTIADTDMIGIGPSAISYIGNVYAQNEKRLFKYYRPLENGDLSTSTGCVLSHDDLVRRWVIEQLMCNFRLSFNELEKRFAIDFDEYFAGEVAALRSLQAEGFYRREKDGLEVLPLGKVFIRDLAMVFDAYIKKSRSSVQYSRTV